MLKYVYKISSLSRWLLNSGFQSMKDASTSQVTLSIFVMLLLGGLEPGPQRANR